MLTDIKSDDICHLHVPYYEGLSIEEIVQESKKYPNVKDYLPEGPDLARMPRQWCINIVYTIAEEPFEAWINA